MHASFDSAVESLEEAGFVLHEFERGSAAITNIGIVLDRDKMVLRHNHRRTCVAIKHVLRLRRITTEAMRVVVGHIVYFFLTQRAGLSTLYHVYKFIYAGLDGKSHFIPGSVKRELRMVVGLLFLVEVQLAASYLDVVYCGDSSTNGFAFHWTRSTAEEQRPLFRFRERWRFVEVEADFGHTCGGHSSWNASLEVPNISYTRWLAQRVGLPLPGSGELEKGCSCFDNKQQRAFEIFDLVPRLPEYLLQPDRWNLIAQKRWKFGETIHMKEARVALMSLRRESRRVGSHNKRLLTFCDNLAAVCAFDKGKTRDVGLLSLCRRAAAIVFSAGIQWRLTYVESARNPSDKGSRLLDHLPAPGTSRFFVPKTEPSCSRHNRGTSRFFVPKTEPSYSRQNRGTLRFFVPKTEPPCSRHNRLDGVEDSWKVSGSGVANSEEGRTSF